MEDFSFGNYFFALVGFLFAFFGICTFLAIICYRYVDKASDSISDAVSISLLFIVLGLVISLYSIGSQGFTLLWLASGSASRIMQIIENGKLETQTTFQTTMDLAFHAPFGPVIFIGVWYKFYNGNRFVHIKPS